jgi:hypothetical protein
VDAAFMLLQVHGWDIHVVKTVRRARAASHGSALGAHEHHGPQLGQRHPLEINSSSAIEQHERGIRASSPV